MCVILLLFGAARYYDGLPRLDGSSVAFFNDGPIAKVVARVSEPPREEKGYQRLVLGNIRDETGRFLSGKILAKSRLYPQYQYGDTVFLEGGLKTAPQWNEFNYRDFLAADGIYSLASFPKLTLVSSARQRGFHELVFSLKRQTEAGIKKLLPEPESSLLLGIVFGSKNSLPPDFYELLRKSGTTHVVVASGQNISFVVAALLMVGFFARGRFAKFLFAASGVIFYVALVGEGASVLRAGLANLAVLVSAALGFRRGASFALLPIAALLLFFNPLDLRQLDFQLSFAASAGIIYLRAIFPDRLWESNTVLREGLLTTLSAQVAVFPVLLHNFQSLSLVSPLANLLVFWLVPIIMLLGVILAVISWVFPPLAPLFAALAYVPLKTFVLAVSAAGSLPFAQVNTPKPHPAIWLFYYAFLAGLVLWHEAKTGVLHR